MYVHVCLYLPVRGQKKALELLELKLHIGGCELPIVGAGYQTQVLYKSLITVTSSALFRIYSPYLSLRLGNPR